MSTLSDRFAAGDIAVGHMISEFWTRGIARITSAAGFDFLVYDMEHSGASLNDLADQISWARATSLTTLVRPPSGSYEHVARALDVGVDGIMAPRIESAVEAADVVASARYPPLGKRGISAGGSHDDYRPKDVATAVARANENTIVAIQIETRSAFEQIDEITATAGVAVAWFGPHDFALECGLEGASGEAAVYEAAAEIAASCERAGIVAAIQPSSLDEAERYLALGYRCVSFGKDSSVYLDACRQAVAAVRARSTS
jgi:2-keto-3-deoxy-L-rhamnonate aldolase RhmA